MDKISLGVSSCLLGNKVRYDGNHKHERYITDTLGMFFDLHPVCPEFECGLGVPREAMRLVEMAGGTRLVTINSGIDLTGRMRTWIDNKIAELENEPLAGFIFKTKSPSSAFADAKVYTEKGVVRKKGPGLFAAAFIERFPLVPVTDEGRLLDPGLRENFIERVFVFARWRALLASHPKTADLVAFHTVHKLLLMAYAPAAVSRLGAIVSSCGRVPSQKALIEYGDTLMKTIAKPATVKRHTNVLQHMAGYFKKSLAPDEKQELQEVIEHYHRGLVPLIVPITLIRHHTRVHQVAYLASQVYLNPHPAELMLRNHV